MAQIHCALFCCIVQELSLFETVYCDMNDLILGLTLTPTFSPTLTPTKLPSWKADGWEKDAVDWKADGWEEPTPSPTRSPSKFSWYIYFITSMWCILFHHWLNISTIINLFFHSRFDHAQPFLLAVSHFFTCHVSWTFDLSLKTSCADIYIVLALPQSIYRTLNPSKSPAWMDDGWKDDGYKKKLSESNSRHSHVVYVSFVW
mgnify:CR=1 FL=1